MQIRGAVKSFDFRTHCFCDHNASFFSQSKTMARGAADHSAFPGGL